MSFPHTPKSKKRNNNKSKPRSKSKSPKPPPLKPTTSDSNVNSQYNDKNKKRKNRHTFNTPPVQSSSSIISKNYRVVSPTPTQTRIKKQRSSSKSRNKKRSTSRSSSKSSATSPRSPSPASRTNKNGKKRKSGKTESTPLRKPKNAKKKPKIDTNDNNNYNPNIDQRRNLSPKNSPNNRKRKSQQNGSSHSSSTAHSHSISTSPQPKEKEKEKRTKQRQTKSEMNGNNNSNHPHKRSKKISSKGKKRTFYGDKYSTKSKGKLQTKYKVKEKIGSGTFSTVRRGIRRSDKKEIAIKIITKTELNETEARLIKREIGVMQKLDHPNIVQLYDIFETSHHLYLIIEYCRGGELFDELINCTPSGWFSEREASQIIKQIAQSLQYMHNKMIIHRDLKLENILISMKKNYQINTKQKKFSIDNDIDEYSSTTQNKSKSNNKNNKNNNKNGKNKARSRGVSSHVVQFKSNKHIIDELKRDISYQAEEHGTRMGKSVYDNYNDDDEEYYSDSHNEDLDNLINRRHSEYISAIPHDLLFGNGTNDNDTASSIIIKVSDFGLSKRLIRNNDDNDNKEDKKEQEEEEKKKKKKTNVLSKKKRKNKTDHVNDHQFAVMATNCGTLYYVAPEILNNEPYNEKVDMWSLGVICYVLLCGSLPFYSENELEISDMILSCKYDLGQTDDHWLKVSDSAKDLIKKLLTLDKLNRLSATQVLQHPFITGSKKLTSQKRKSVKWNAGSLLGKWQHSFRNMIDSAKMSFGTESDLESDDEQHNNNNNNNYKQPPSPNMKGNKIHYKISYNNNGNNNGNYLESPNISSNNLQYSDVSELETEQSAVE